MPYFRSERNLKTIKAVSVLVPLFGLQYLVVAFTPEAHSLHKIVIEFVKAVITSFQGLVVSLLFCFFNSEVVQQIQRRYRRRQRQSQIRYAGSVKTGSSFRTRGQSFSQEHDALSDVKV